MKKYVLPQALLLLYDCARLGLALGFFNERAAVFISVNALFPIMDFFLLCDGGKYRPYGPLYAAGKALCVFSAALWTVFALASGGHGLRFPLFQVDSTVLFVIIMIATDLISLGARLAIHNRLGRQQAQTGESALQSLGEIAKCE